MYKTQTQIKLGGARKENKEPSHSSHSTLHHSRPGGGSSGEKFTLNIFQGVTSEPIQDDMTYRRSARLIVTMDIIISTFLLVAYLISLVSGSAHQSSTKTGSRVCEASSGTSVNSSLKIKQPSLHGQSEAAAAAAAAVACTAEKQRETLNVLVWMGLFAVCIFQLLVAGGTLGGTYERDGRKTIRNCRIWIVSTCVLVVVLIIQVVVLLIIGKLESHHLQIVLLIAEIAFRSTGLVIVSRFIKELSLEFCSDDEIDLGDRFFYEKLCPSPNPQTVETRHV